MSGRSSTFAGTDAMRGRADATPAPVGLEREPLRDAAYIAALLGIPKKTVLQCAREGRLPCIRIGKHVRFMVADVERAVETMRTAA